MPDFLTKPILKQGAVTLRPFCQTDIPRMLAILALPQVNLYTGALTKTPSPDDRFPATPKETTRIIAWYQTRNQQTARLDLAIVTSDKLVGEIVLNRYDALQNTCNLRVLIADDATGRGIGTTALNLMVAYAFNGLQLAALTLDVFDFNPRARHVYRKVGFTPIGAIENDLTLDGQPHTTFTMRLTADSFAKKGTQS